MADLFARLAARANESGRPAVSPRLPARFESAEAAPEDHDGRGLSDVEHPDSGRDASGRNESLHGFRRGVAPARRVAMSGRSDGQVSDDVVPGSFRAREMVQPAETGPAAATHVVRTHGANQGNDDGSEPDDLPQIFAPGKPVQYGLTDEPGGEFGPMSTAELAASRIRPVLVGGADLVPPNDSALKPEMRQPAKPEVHISIGRIEVRAAPAPAASAPTMQITPPDDRGLSLAAYLRGDDGRPR